MAGIDESLRSLMALDGSVAACLVDFNTGMALGKVGTVVDLDIAAAGNAEAVRANLKTVKALKLDDTIEDILITLDSQYHIIRPLATKAGLFVYVVLDKAKADLALARCRTTEVESNLSF